MKLNDDTDLVPLDVTNQCVQSIWNTGTSTSAGSAGANANSWSMVNMLTFMGKDPLTELVWSQNGLGIKCFPERESCFLRDVGPSTGCTKDEKRASQGQLVASRETSQVDDGFGKCCSSIKTRRSSDPCRLHESRGTEEIVGEENGLNISKSMTAGNLAETGEGPENRITTDILPLSTNEAKTAVRSLPDLESSEREVVEKGKGKMKEDDSLSGHFLENLEVIAENDVQDLVAQDHIFDNEERAQKGDLVPSEASSIDNKKDEDDSHGSMDSCNSISLSPKGKRKWSFDQSLILGSKRIKKQTKEFTYLKPVIKQDSSFMNWISNMVKGLDKPNQEDDNDQKIGVFGNCQSKKSGFQSVFQSLYSNDPNAYEKPTHIEDKAIGGSKEIILAASGGSCHDRNDILKQTSFEHEESTPICALNNDKVSSFDSSNGVKTSNYLGSLWVTRLYPKTRNLEADFNIIQKGNRNECSEKIDEIPKQLSSRFAKGNLNKDKVMLEAPKGIFDSIRRLRLSRSDILRWANSQFSAEHLHGYFLRLRLAKCEAGVGGAGYYVACITGLQGEKASKKRIHVNVGGVECLVESQHISNCDFLEEELASWWQKTISSESGGVWIENDLKSKLEERKTLGF